MTLTLELFRKIIQRPDPSRKILSHLPNFRPKAQCSLSWCCWSRIEDEKCRRRLSNGPLPFFPASLPALMEPIATWSNKHLMFPSSALFTLQYPFANTHHFFPKKCDVGSYGTCTHVPILFLLVVLTLVEYHTWTGQEPKHVVLKGNLWLKNCSDVFWIGLRIKRHHH